MKIHLELDFYKLNTSFSAGKYHNAKWVSLTPCQSRLYDGLGACYVQGNNMFVHREYPPNDIEVNVYVFIDKFRLVEKDEVQQTLTAHMKLRMFWQDPRIKANFSHDEEVNTFYDFFNVRVSKSLLRGKEVRDRIKMWIPDYAFDNELMVTPMAGPSVETSVKINREALEKISPVIEMSLDIKITVLCEFTFLEHPMDFQTCYFTFQNKRYQNNKYWIHKLHQDISIWGQFRALGFDIEIQVFEGIIMGEEKTGFQITMRRVLTPFVLQCYSPAIAIVLISSIGFIVPLSDPTGRIALGVTLFLTIASIFYDNRVTFEMIIIPHILNKCNNLMLLIAK